MISIVFCCKKIFLKLIIKKVNEMSQILNYEKGETLATGFVRPKVTSLFFDKIWIPEEVLESSFEFMAIPKEVLVTEKKKGKLKNDIIKNTKLNYKVATKENTSMRISDMDFLKTFDETSKRLSEYTKINPAEFNIINKHDNVENVIEDNGNNNVKFKYSKNRNQAILLNAENFTRAYKLNISPIFHDLTEFEREVQFLDVRRLYGNQTIRYKLKRPNVFENKNVFGVCIQDFPCIKEDALSWEQVLDVRKDDKRREQLKRFTTWANKNFVNYSPNQIRETLESELESYKDVLKEHGIKTIVGSFTTLVSSTSSIASIISEPDNLLLPLLSITAVSIGFTSNTYMSCLKNKKTPIAYLYDLKNGEI